MAMESGTRRYGLYAWFLRGCGRAWVYALLAGGAVVFSWPFVWMATTSVKVDREMFGEQLHLWPQRPAAPLRSPYVDERYFRDVGGARFDELCPRLEARLRAMPGVWPDDVDRDSLVRQTARGVFRKLVYLLPLESWNLPLESLEAEARHRLDEKMVREIVPQVRRHLAIGQLRARSYDLQEEQLVAPDRVAETWQVDGSATARLVPRSEAHESYADLAYDFSSGAVVRLSRVFTLRFPATRLHRLQLYLQNDDSWHALTVYVEKGGVRYEAERTYDLGDFTWGVATWQEPGPDDLTNKIRTWTLLREVGRGPSYERDPNRIRVTLELTRHSTAAAWWAKARRNYRFALDYIPFWRYVATSLFLVILNLVGTLFSCSLVAYSFARLQWPGRNFSFALMLATLMIPGQVTMIPHFLIVRSLGWYGTLYPLWVGSFFAGAFNVFLLRQFLKGIPRDLEDAARIDGCGFWRVYWYVMLPLVRPTLAAIAIFTFMGTWNDFMGPLIYLNDQRLYPLSLGLYAFNVQAGGNMGMMMAGSLLMTVPVIAIFFFAQKYFIQGVTLTGMKG